MTDPTHSKSAATETFRRECVLPVPAADAFRWHERAALRRLIPPWEAARVVAAPESLRDGARGILELSLAPFIKKRWLAEHFGFDEGKQFCDRQVKGPFASWEHFHRFHAQDDHCRLEDEIHYKLPGGAVGRWLGQAYIRRQLERMFRFRHDVTRHDLAAHARFGEKTMKVAITGSSGLVGADLIPFLEGGGHEVIRIVRRAPQGDDEIRWDPERGSIDAAGLEGLDAVIHLAGESIAEGRWNEAKKRRILESRVEPTKLLSQTLAKLSNPPKVLVSASAIGFYGERGDELLDESEPPGDSFLADVCQGWELATESAEEAGIRVVHGRIGVVLTPKGGALKPMLLPFKMGMGGIVGNGKQFWSCISLDDLIGALHHCVMTESLSGPVNLVSPDPVTNHSFTKTLGAVLGRPTFLPMPAFAARILLGEMADALIMTSTRVTPQRLLESGYEFRHPTVDAALRHVLGAAPAKQVSA